MRGAVELLRELAALLPGALLAARDACMSAGRSFHSVSGRAVWYDIPIPTPPGGPGLRFGEGPLLLGGGGERVPAAADVVASTGGVGAAGWLSRFAAKAVVLGGTVLSTAPAPFAWVGVELVVMRRLTIHALSGRSLR